MHRNLVAIPKTTCNCDLPSCSASGISFDGNSDYIDITDWRWGGKTSFETLVKFDDFDSDWNPVIDFGNGNSHDNVKEVVALESKGHTSTISWNIRYGDAYEEELAGNFDLSAWTHVVVTVSGGGTMKIYKNGAHVGTHTSGNTPKLLTRDHHWLGRSFSNSFFDGTIAYVSMWNDRELTSAEVTSAFCPSGKYGQPEFEGKQCTVCPKGKYSLSPNTMACTNCDAGKFLSDDGQNVYEHNSANDCTVCAAGKWSR